MAVPLGDYIRWSEMNSADFEDKFLELATPTEEEIELAKAEAVVPLKYLLEAELVEGEL